MIQLVEPWPLSGKQRPRDLAGLGRPPRIRWLGCRAYQAIALFLVLLGTEPASAQFQWSQVATSPATRPAARVYPGMIYESVRGVVLLHGGLAVVGGQVVVFGDTWAWNGGNWMRLTGQGPATCGFGMAFDPDRGVTVLHGGIGAGSPPLPVIGATWEWNGQVWREVGDGSGPGKRAGSAMAYDPQRRRVLLHGGTVANPIGGTTLSDTWEWDGTSWRQILDANGPARAQHQMAYDEERQVMTLFGGVEAPALGPVDTWEFDGSQWHQVATVGPPGAREFPILAYDRLRQATILTSGGENHSGGFLAWKYFNDFWEWNGETWVEVPVEGTHPTPVLGSAGAYDPRRAQLVQFGGAPDGANQIVSDETWVYGLASLRLTEVLPTGDSFEIHWTGGAAPYQLQSCSEVTVRAWQNEGPPTNSLSAMVQTDGTAKFFRVLSLLGAAP